MFNIKYNLLVIFQIILGILNYILLLRVFGVSINSDAYLLTTSSFIVLTLLESLPFGQIIPYYNDLKTMSIKKSNEFYNSSLLFSFIIGIGFFIFANIFITVITKLFAFHIDPERMLLFRQLLQIASFGFIFYPINQINEQLLNAEMKFSIPYMLACLPTLFIVITQLMMINYHSYNIKYLVLAQSIGFMVIAIFGTVYIARYLVPFKLIFWTDALSKEIKNSSIIKIGDFFWGISIPVLFNNFLATFPKGYISYFYYARKIIDITNNFTLGPSVKILYSKISKLLAIKDFKAIKILSRKFLILGGIIFIVALIITYFIHIPILKIVTLNKLKLVDLQMISLIYLTLCPWYVIRFFETPFCATTRQAKKAKTIFFITIIFLVVFAPLLFVLRAKLGIYALGISCAIAQLLNLILYIKSSNRILKT